MKCCCCTHCTVVQQEISPVRLIRTVHVDVEEQHLQTEDQGLGDSEEDIMHFSWTYMNEIKSYQYKDTDILLYTGSTFLVFKNSNMILNKRDSGRTLKAYTNGGRYDPSQVADLPGVFTVWFNLSSMINKYCLGVILLVNLE